MQIKINTLETRCKLVDSLIQENKELSERLVSAEAAKEAMMRLVWQHLETINKTQEENKILSTQLNEV